MATLRLSLAAAAILLGSIIVACTTTTTTTSNGSSSGSSGENLPEVGADQLGQSCSGVGTSIGDTAAFASESCPAGICVADARSGLSTFCSADCTKVRCPAGWACEDTTVGGKRVCFPTGEPVDDAGADAPMKTFVDEPLTGYRAGATAKSTFAISDFKDPTRSKVDIVVVVVGGLWDTFGTKFLSDLEKQATIPRVSWVVVVMDGTKPEGGATTSDLDKWHASYPKRDMLLDSRLAKLGSGIPNVTAIPTFVVLHAATLKVIERTVGAPTDISGQVDTWRAKAK